MTLTEAAARRAIDNEIWCGQDTNCVVSMEGVFRAAELSKEVKGSEVGAVKGSCEYLNLAEGIVGLLATDIWRIVNFLRAKDRY